MIVDIFNELESAPFLFAVLICKVRLAYWMTIEGDPVPFHHRIVTINSYRFTVV